MKSTLILLVSTLIVALTVTYAVLDRTYGSAPSSIAPLAEEESELPMVETRSDPQTIVIKRIGVETQVEHVGADSDGRMDVPEDAGNVAWWNLGVRPGEAGNSVVAGHYDNPDGSPSTFYKLSELTDGDVVEVTGEQGSTLLFEVVRKAYFADADFPIEEVFGKSDRRNLNLITCAGAFDKGSNNYDERLVVFTTLVD